MRKKYIFGKKLYISVLTSILVLLTTVATTFAWVGVFANSTFDQFDVLIRVNNLKDYGIEISTTGEPDSFSDTIKSEDIKKQILLNWGYTESKIEQIGVDNLFYGLNMEQCTTLPNISDNKINSLGDFKTINGEKTKKYYTFDVYISAVQFYDSGVSTDYKLDVFLGEGLLKGTEKRRWVVNPFSYPNNFINPLSSESLLNGIVPITGGDVITNAKVDSKGTYRVAFEKYDVIDKYQPQQYTSLSTPKSAIIYTGDSYNYPTYNSKKDVYEFGGILEDDINMAIGNYNSYESIYADSHSKTVSVSNVNADIYGGDVFAVRGVTGTNPDVIFTSTTNHLIDSTNLNEQIGVNQMMKIKVSFWVEGWDADCYNVTGGAPVTLSITFGIKNEEVFS